MNLPKNYEPNQYETDIYALWERSGAFQPTGQGQPFSIVMPPPNANANLHIGYELTAALEDIMARYHRLKGDDVLLLPGADHAGFETQVVYEKHLAKQGKSRFDFSREQMYSQIWDFVAQNRDNFESQLRRMGVSCDWTRYTFTLDPKIVKQAYATFKKMWDEGLIYRGERLVNFCTFHGTAFADIEVSHKEEDSKLWYLRYPLTDGSGEVVVATTRPETMFGDVAVAIHPEDGRYNAFKGKSVRLPLTNRVIPIITDSFVEREFGTGAVKITPAHDPNDFEVGERHDLPKISVIDTDGKLNAEAPDEYRGLTVDEARSKVVDALEEQGFLVKTEDYSHSVGHCYKCGTVIQPLLRDQWFVDMQPLARPAIAKLEADEIKFYPEAKKTQLISYLKNLKDWNISRQNAWGIPIPAFQNVDEPDDWIYDERVDQEIIEVNGKTYARDPDVFDTWFSSSSWPYATLGYPDSPDFKRFYPLSVMETGGEILYPWVSRMIILGLYVAGEIPFKDVYIHGYVMAEDGSKMSKSIGNVVDPLPVIEKYGSDALRMGIIAGRAAAVNRGYDPRKVEDARNFCNKLWNIARYTEGLIAEAPRIDEPKPESLADHWLLSKLQQSQSEIFADLDNYRFGEAYEKLYHFVWDDFADWYVEASKAQPNLSLLAFSLGAVLTLAHPFAPFVTETIWQTIGREGDTLLATRVMPALPKFDPKKAAAFNEIQAVVSESRFIVKELGLKDVSLHYVGSDMLRNNAELIMRLGRIKELVEGEPDSGLALTSTQQAVWLAIDRSTAERYLDQLNQKQAAQAALIAQLKGRLNNPAYVENAPHEIVEQTRHQLADAQSLLDNLDAEYAKFKQSSV
jgi:valyl-tRNA synthetase